MKSAKAGQTAAYIQLKKLSLHAQGLLNDAPFGKGLIGAKRAIEHLGYVQIDSISVVERAHHHVLATRVPGYAPPMLEQLLAERTIYEYWSHAAAFLPMSEFRFSLPYKQAIKSGQTHWYKNRDHKLMDELLARVRVDGPLRSRDLDQQKGKKHSGWWDWKPAKQALEQLYMQGDLMVTNREGFQKTYDLSERVLPSAVDTSEPSIDEYAAHLLDQQLRSNGLASLKSCTYLRRNTALRRSVKALIDEGCALGTLEPVTLDNGDAYVVAAGALDSAAPRLSNRLSILSPFDNCVIQRERLKAVFGFEYQIECYVPEAKRRFGYFSLPLLYRDTFVGRMDCKAHRSEKHLEIKSLHFEPHDFDQDSLIEALSKAIAGFRKFQGCETVSVGTVRPQRLQSTVRKALSQ